jgi:hypothetical protein
MEAVLIIWYLLGCLGVYEAARGAMLKKPKAVAMGILWPIFLPVAGLVALGLAVVDMIRTHLE